MYRTTTDQSLDHMNYGDSRNKQITITSVKIQQNPMHHMSAAYKKQAHWTGV